MKREWREYFETWARTEEFRKKVQKAHERLRWVGQNFKNPAVLFSGGKDSTVGVHLALQHFPRLRVFHFVYHPSEIPTDIGREILRNAKLLGIRDIVIRREKKRLEDDRWFFFEVRKFIREYNVDCIISCLRAEESKRRRRLIIKSLYFHGVPNVHVIKDWTWKDVWAYIISRKLPYLSIYDKYAELVGWDNVRFAGFFYYTQECLNNESVDKHLMWRYFHQR